MTNYDDWITKLIDFIETKIINIEKYRKAFMDKFKYNLDKKSLKLEVQKGVAGYSKRIQGASTTPKGQGFRNYKYIKFTLTDDYEQLLMSDAKELDIYFMDYSYLDLSDKVFYIKGKSAAQRFLLSDDATTYRDTHEINKYLNSGQAFENKFYLQEVSSSEYKEAPDNKKIKLLKDDV